ELAVPALGLLEAPLALALGAEHLDPAARVEELRGAGLGGERLVLAYAMLDELGIAARHLCVACRPGVVPVLPQEGREPRQGARVVLGVDRAVEAVADEGAEDVRKAVRVDAFALDQAGVAERGFFCRSAPVEQDDRAAAF